MTAYFIRRLLLVPPTFVAITFMVYALLRIVPGGPIEQAEAALRMSAMEGGAGGGATSLGSEADLQLDEEALGELERYYALDRSIPVGYLQWLGAWPREFRTRVQATTLERHADAFAPLLELHARTTELEAELAQILTAHGWTSWAGALYEPLPDEERAQAAPPDVLARAAELEARGFGKRDELLALLADHGLTFQQGRYVRRLDARGAHRGADDPQATADAARARELLAALGVAERKRAEIRAVHGFEITDTGRIYAIDERASGILQLDFGRSYTRSEPVLKAIASKIGISLQFGGIAYVVTWLVCVPLGIAKAIRHRTHFDAATSFVVFLGYSMPGFVVCMLLLTGVAAHVDWLPLGGAAPDDVASLPPWEAFVGRVRHMLIPVTGYIVGNFATMTILMKNSLLENLAADYVRTAFAKGLTERRVVFVHALRNSLIPITAGIGYAIGILFAGSFLIEKTCNIDGMGLLGFEAILLRDYPIILGLLVFGVLIQLIGNILSDLVWAAIDPRIRFQDRAS